MDLSILQLHFTEVSELPVMSMNNGLIVMFIQLRFLVTARTAALDEF